MRIKGTQEIQQDFSGDFQGVLPGVTEKINQRLNNKNSTAPDNMNEQSPLVPQGSLMEQKNKGRARVKIAVFFVLTIHGVALLALLMQGCQKEKETAKTDQSTPAAPTFDPSNAAAPEAVTAAMPTNPPIVTEPTSAP